MLNTLVNALSGPRITTSERHLRHMGNQSYGSSPIGYALKSKAVLAQDAPIRNLTKALFQGLL